MKTRSDIMRAIRSKDTKPEMTIRRLVHGLGYRYRLHRSDLPGKPDLTFPSRRKVIFVHGCFWHGHECKRGARMPKTNVSYWARKIARNMTRDLETLARLKFEGWRVVVIWECELANTEKLKTRIARLLS